MTVTHEGKQLYRQEVSCGTPFGFGCARKKLIVTYSNSVKKREVETEALLNNCRGKFVWSMKGHQFHFEDELGEGVLLGRFKKNDKCNINMMFAKQVEHKILLQLGSFLYSMRNNEILSAAHQHRRTDFSVFQDIVEEQRKDISLVVAVVSNRKHPLDRHSVKYFNGCLSLHGFSLILTRLCSEKSLSASLPHDEWLLFASIADIKSLSDCSEREEFFKCLEYISRNKAAFDQLTREVVNSLQTGERTFELLQQLDEETGIRAVIDQSQRLCKNDLIKQKGLFWRIGIGQPSWFLLDVCVSLLIHPQASRLQVVALHDHKHKVVDEQPSSKYEVYLDSGSKIRYISGSSFQLVHPDGAMQTIRSAQTYDFNEYQGMSIVEFKNVLFFKPCVYSAQRLVYLDLSKLQGSDAPAFSTISVSGTYSGINALAFNSSYVVYLAQNGGLQPQSQYSATLLLSPVNCPSFPEHCHQLALTPIQPSAKLGRKQLLSTYSTRISAVFTESNFLATLAVFFLESEKEMDCFSKKVPRTLILSIHHIVSPMNAELVGTQEIEVEMDPTFVSHAMRNSTMYHFQMKHYTVFVVWFDFLRPPSLHAVVPRKRVVLQLPSRQFDFIHRRQLQLSQINITYVSKKRRLYTTAILSSNENNSSRHSLVVFSHIIRL